MMRFDFLMCSERSGSNLMTKLLNAHPELCGSFPSHVTRQFGENYFRYGDVQRDENWDVLLEDVAYYFDHLYTYWKKKPTLEELRSEVKTRSLAAIVRYVYEQEAAAHGKSRVFVKENHSYRLAPYFLAHFPDCKFVYVVRDPRDMALSWIDLQFKGYIDKAIDAWKGDQSQGMRLYSFLRDIDRCILVLFEDLITETEREMKRVSAFLGIEFTPKMLEFHVDPLVVQNSTDFSGWSDLRKPIQSDNKRTYPGRLNETEIRYIEAVCRREMAFFGYEPDFDESVDLQTLEEAVAERARSFQTEDEVGGLAHLEGVALTGEQGMNPVERGRFSMYAEALQRIQSRRLYPQTGGGRE